MGKERMIKVNKPNKVEKKLEVSRPLSDKDILITDTLKEKFLESSKKQLKEAGYNLGVEYYPNNPFYNLTAEGMEVLFSSTSEFMFNHRYFKSCELTLNSVLVLFELMEQLESSYCDRGIVLDYVYVHKETMMKSLNIKSWETIIKAFELLVLKGILAKKSRNEYWVNPYHMFYGTRSFFFYKFKYYLKQYLPSLYIKYRYLDEQS